MTQSLRNDRGHRKLTWGTPWVGRWSKERHECSLQVTVAISFRRGTRPMRQGNSRKEKDQVPWGWNSSNRKTAAQDEKGLSLQQRGGRLQIASATRTLTQWNRLPFQPWQTPRKDWLKKVWQVHIQWNISHKKRNTATCSNRSRPREYNETSDRKRQKPGMLQVCGVTESQTWLSDWTELIWYHWCVESKDNTKEYIYKAETDS